MPRLLMFAPCMKAIIDREDSSVSMIAIMSTIKRGHFGDQEEELPPNAIVSFSWAAVSVWLRVPGDEGKTFEQRMEVILPDGKPFGGATVRFEMTDRVHHNTVAGTNFPVGQLGEHILRVSLREVIERISDEADWQTVMDYPVELAEQV